VKEQNLASSNLAATVDWLSVVQQYCGHERSHNGKLITFLLYTVMPEMKDQSRSCIGKSRENSSGDITSASKTKTGCHTQAFHPVEKLSAS